MKTTILFMAIAALGFALIAKSEVRTQFMPVRNNPEFRWGSSRPSYANKRIGQVNSIN